MRPLAILVPLVLLAGCGTEGTLRKPPAGRFYFPTAVVHLPAASGEGHLVVASSNFDNRYDFGMVTSVALDGLGIPAFGTAVEAPVELPELNLPAGEGCDPNLGCEIQGAQERLIETFAAADVGVLPRADGVRVFVPTRGSTNRLHALDVRAADGSVECAPGATGDDPSNCTSSALSVTQNEFDDVAKPNAPEPAAATVDVSTGEVFAVHRYPAFDPIGSGSNPQSYVVRADGTQDTLTPDFWPVGVRGASSITLAGRYALVTGYSDRGSTIAPLLRAIDRTDPSRLFDLSLERSFRSLDTRGSALSSDGKRLFLIGRAPDMLIIVALEDLTGERPMARAIRGVPLPDDPNHLVVIPRAGQGDLVAITCAQAGAVVLYDEDLGQISAQAFDVGGQPFGITAVRQPTAGARLYITHFSDGQVGVYDIPDLVQARTLRQVARLGESQRCITDEQGC